SSHIQCHAHLPYPPSFPTRRSSDLTASPHAIPSSPAITAPLRPAQNISPQTPPAAPAVHPAIARSTPRLSHPPAYRTPPATPARSEEHTSELQSRENLVCRLLLEKK